jgi:hypothetical protein
LPRLTSFHSLRFVLPTRYAIARGAALPATLTDFALAGTLAGISSSSLRNDELLGVNWLHRLNAEIFDADNSDLDQKKGVTECP